MAKKMWLEIWSLRSPRLDSSRARRPLPSDQVTRAHRPRLPSSLHLYSTGALEFGRQVHRQHAVTTLGLSFFREESQAGAPLPSPGENEGRAGTF